MPEDGKDFDFHQHLGVDETSDLRRGRNVFQTGPVLPERGLNPLRSGLGL